MLTFTACLLCLLAIGKAEVELETSDISHSRSNSFPETVEMTVSLEMMEQGLRFTINHVKAFIQDSILTSDADGLSLNRTTVNLEALEALCDPGETFLVGRHCRKQLSKGDCSANVPCEILNWVKDEAPDALLRFVAAESYEEIYKIIFGDMFVPIWRTLCGCPDFVSSAISCVKNYDGSLFEVIDNIMTQSEFDEIVKSLDWKSVRTVIEGVLQTGCGEEGCLEDMTLHQTRIGQVLDNTFGGQVGCLSLKRVEEEIIGLMLSLVHEGDAENVKAYIDECLKLWDALMCDERCSSEMQRTFYSSCCIKQASQQLNSRKMRKNFTAVFENVWSLLSEEEPPSGVVNKYLSMFDPAKFCAGKTRVYEEFNKQCKEA